MPRSIDTIRASLRISLQIGIPLTLLFALPSITCIALRIHHSWGAKNSLLLTLRKIPFLDDLAGWPCFGIPGVDPWYSWALYFIGSAAGAYGLWSAWHDWSELSRQERDADLALNQEQLKNERRSCR